ncbi:MAG: PEGA domain-containing protein [Sandaracinaceae bacterium]|nr:PEGA domain-containing protein [Sandaracinaceae bacterium]
MSHVHPHPLRVGAPRPTKSLLSARGALALALLALASVTAVPSVARADEASEARFHDARARAHFEARDFPRAIEEFLWAHRIAPNPRLLYNVALCFQQLRDAENAFSYFAEYLAQEDTLDGHEGRRGEAEHAMQALLAEVARARVVSDPPGASIYVDTPDHGSYGLTPRLVALAPGTHRVMLSRPGFEDVSVEVELVRGQEVAVDASLVRVVGTMQLESRTAIPVQVHAPDGTLVAEGTAPGEFSLAPGAYTVSGRNDTFEVVAAVATVTANETARVRLSLVDVPVPVGDATVTANTTGALLLLDGVEVGFTPSLVRDLPAGLHRLRIEEPGRDPWEGELEVRPGEQTWVTATLRASGRPRRSPIGISVGAVGLAGLLAFAVTAPMARRSHQDFQRLQLSDPTRAVSARERGRLLNRTSDVLLGVGSILAGVGVTLFFVLDDPNDAPSSATVSFQRP